jgi:hypothetical protein
LEAPNFKHQASNESKKQKPSMFETSSQSQFRPDTTWLVTPRLDHSPLGISDLFEIWCLELGALSGEGQP